MSENRRIQKLDESVINKIAAGEILQRPANAVKELLENSLDAGSSQIIISVKQGGLGLIQVQDNGCGISKEDFPILCERFTTSKLQEFKDLMTIQTFGFRGEALASMTHVAHVEVTSKTVDSVCAIKGSFSDSRLKESPRPCAGNTGTIVRVEDLFYNIPIRKQSLKNVKEEFAKIIEIVSNYAVLNGERCAITLKRIDDKVSSSPDVRIALGTSIEDCIIEVYGGELSKQLLPLECHNHKLGYSVNGRISKPGYNSRKFRFILFINNRLVHCELLKKCLENIYSNILPKKAFPFIFLHLQIPANNVDVNVHPTKNEVHFLHQELIVSSIQELVEKSVLSASESRAFSTQSLLNKSRTSNDSLSRSLNQSFRPSEKIRTDPTLRKIECFFPNNERPAVLAQPRVALETVSSPKVDVIATRSDQDHHSITKKESPMKLSEDSVIIPAKLIKKIELSTISNLRNAIETTNLCDWKKFVYVGMIDKDRILIQRNEDLLLVNTPIINYNLFYQLTLHYFGNFGQIDIVDENSKENDDGRSLLKDLFAYGLKETGGLYSQVDAERSLKPLVEQAAMLEDYFSIKIDCERMTLQTIPIVLDKFIPDLRKLPKFIFNLCTKVNWADEQSCLHNICREIAEFYAYGIGNSTSLFADKRHFEEVFENVVLPMYRTFLRVPLSFEHDGTLVKLTCLPDLYRVFERC